MIDFINKNAWSEDLLKSIIKNENPIIIDFNDYEICNEHLILNKLQKYLRASFSTKEEEFGNNLNALKDVVSDFFIENWLKWNNVYILGWGRLTENQPIFTQKILDIILSSYIESIAGKLREIKWKEITFEDAKLLQAIEEFKPKIFLILN